MSPTYCPLFARAVLQVSECHLQQNQEKRTEYPKKPPTSYNFYIKDKRDKIVRNNPGLNSVGLIYYLIFSLRFFNISLKNIYIFYIDGNCFPFWKNVQGPQREEEAEIYRARKNSEGKVSKTSSRVQVIT